VSLEMKVDLSFNDLDMLFKEYEEVMIRRMWELGEDGPGSGKSGSGKLYKYVNKVLPPKPSGHEAISRASIILAANRFVDKDIWDYRTTTGKGGHHRVYFAIMTEEDLWKALKKTANTKFDKLLEAGA